jgi:hypothetical protein
MPTARGGARPGADGQEAPAAPGEGRAYDAPEIVTLLERPHVGHREVPRARQIFVNRNLRMDKVELVGFDMDYTLAMYHLQRLEDLAFGMTLARMISASTTPRRSGRSTTTLRSSSAGS